MWKKLRWKENSEDIPSVCLVDVSFKWGRRKWNWNVKNLKKITVGAKRTAVLEWMFDVDPVDCDKHPTKILKLVLQVPVDSLYVIIRILFREPPNSKGRKTVKLGGTHMVQLA